MARCSSVGSCYLSQIESTQTGKMKESNRQAKGFSCHQAFNWKICQLTVDIRARHYIRAHPMSTSIINLHLTPWCINLIGALIRQTINQLEELTCIKQITYSLPFSQSSNPLKIYRTGREYKNLAWPLSPSIMDGGEWQVFRLTTVSCSGIWIIENSTPLSSICALGPNRIRETLGAGVLGEHCLLLRITLITVAITFSIDRGCRVESALIHALQPIMCQVSKKISYSNPYSLAAIDIPGTVPREGIF